MLTVIGLGGYCHYDFQLVNVAVDAVEEYSFRWNMKEIQIFSRLKSKSENAASQAFIGVVQISI